MIKIKTRQKRKKRKLKKRFIVLILIIMLVIIFVMIFKSLNKIIDNNNDDVEDINITRQAQLSTAENVTDDSIYKKYNCKEISREYNENKLQVNLTFDRELFDNSNRSNKEYFDSLIKELVKIYDRNFILKDDNRNIYIDVKVNSHEDYSYTINSIENYFNQAEEYNKQIKNYKEIDKINVKVSYDDFIKFDFNNWSAKASNVKIQEKGENYLDYGEYKALTNNTFINTIILDSDFKEEIIEGIKVGDSFDIIKQKLGAPIFEANNMIGYKTTDIYIFFYNDEVAIYPNIEFNNLEIENLIYKYINGEYLSRGNFAYDVIHTYLDFNSYIDNLNTVNIESTVRGMKIKITKDGDMSIYVYNNYDMTETTKKYIREEIISANFDTDFIYESELNRK